MSSSSIEVRLKELEEICGKRPSNPDSLHDHYMLEIFPLLDMGSWVEHVLSMVPEGKVTTFGSIAKALGTLDASISVGAICSEMGHYRVVYSDGSIPKPSLKRIRDEVGTTERNGIENINEEDMIRDIDIDHPPFVSLALDQDNMREMIRRGKERITGTAGVDISSGGGSHYCAVACVGLDGHPGDHLCESGNVGIPYIRGFLFYREAPLVLPTVARAREESLIDDSTLLVIDGNGRLHPRRTGLACQIGAATDMMTCGVAKKLMFGKIGEFQDVDRIEELAPVMDNKKLIGYASRRSGGSPIFISEGHRTDLVDVTGILLNLKRSRLPEPTRYAHNTANRVRRSEAPSCDL